GAQAVEQWQADGALGMLDDAELLEFREHLSRPLPMANTWLTREMPGVVTVVGDFSTFVRLAVSHLRQLGLRSLAILVLKVGPRIRERFVGQFVQIAKPQNPSQAALVFNAERSLLLNPDAKVTPVPHELAAWLRSLPKPVGVLSPDLGGGGYLIRCCRALKLRVPEDVAVVGGDDTDLGLASQPTLTSVLLSMETIGQEAMAQVAHMMAGKSPTASTVRLTCADLVVRESTGLRRPEICDIAAALECIKNEATRGITVGKVITQTQHVSRVTFHRHFLAQVGKTPALAIRDRKLEEARRLLRSTELPLSMVSDLCGFSDQRVFARLFRQVEGLTPRDYRKRRLARAGKAAAGRSSFTGGFAQV
ncbi:MAG: hypothetical protein C5B50_15305, partial [Verrucomicrobia bacterium]